MKYCIPGELWSQVEVPQHDLTSTNISAYLSEMAYKLPSIAKVTMVKEFWHTVCDFAERCGALRERVLGSIAPDSLALSVGTPTFGAFQRFVGAGVNDSPVGFDRFTTAMGESGVAIVFSASCIPSGAASATAYADVSVVPDVNASPTNQVVPLWFLRKYEKLLLAGALMRIYAMANEKWTDEAGARMNATTYMSEIRRVTHGLITAGMRRHVLVGAESVLARQSTTVNSTTQTSTVG